jgi:2-oxoglutarate ferredoxin oxidoreductase subunit beta
MKTKSTPFGSVEGPINPMLLALASGATYVARGFSGEPKHLTELIKNGILHTGFSFIDVFSPCVTYNHDNTYPWFRERVRKLEDGGAHDASDWDAAMRKATLWGDEIPIGLFYRNDSLPALHQLEPVLDQGGPLAHRELGIPSDVGRQFVEELM